MRWTGLERRFRQAELEGDCEPGRECSTDISEAGTRGVTLVNIEEPGLTLPRLSREGKQMRAILKKAGPGS